MQIDEGNGNAAKGGEPRLVVTVWVGGVPVAYKCSRCGQAFLLPEDRTPQEGTVELWAAFKEHVDEEHRGCTEMIKGSGNEADGTM